MVSVILCLSWVMKLSDEHLKQRVGEGRRGQDNHWHLSYALQYFKSHFLPWDEYPNYYDFLYKKGESKNRSGIAVFDGSSI